MQKLANHAALKEWAAVVSALNSGDQIILVRKGGIADASFGVDADRFYLFPTYLHQKEKQFRSEHLHHFLSTDVAENEPDEVEISSWCEVARIYELHDLSGLGSLSDRVIFTEDTIVERYRFRADQALRVIAVRAFRLPHSVKVRNRAEYGGCRSWVSLEEEVDIDGSTPALSDVEFARRMNELEAALAPNEVNA